MWSLRASDIYQGGETEPTPADRACRAAYLSLDIEFAKNYREVVRSSCDIIRNANSHMTVLYFALSAVRTPDETVWSLRASDIYQGGETEPTPDPACRAKPTCR